MRFLACFFAEARAETARAREAHAADPGSLQAAADRERQMLDQRAADLTAARDDQRARAERAEQAADDARARLAELEGRVPAVGTSRATVARMLNQLRRKGAIHTGYRNIVITDLGLLNEIGQTG